MKVVECRFDQIEGLEGFEVGFDRLEKGIKSGPIFVDDSSVGTIAAKMRYGWHKGELECKGVEVESLLFPRNDRSCHASIVRCGRVFS